jgi:hypothetical protein
MLLWYFSCFPLWFLHVLFMGFIHSGIIVCICAWVCVLLYPGLFQLILCCEHFPKSLVFKNIIFLMTRYHFTQPILVICLAFYKILRLWM